LLTVKDSNIYSDKGVLLKTISCQKNLIDTNNVSEKELVDILTKDKDTCLAINRLNPMFNFT